jgi:hypothetical protein
MMTINRKTEQGCLFDERERVDAERVPPLVMEAPPAFGLTTSRVDRTELFMAKPFNGTAAPCIQCNSDILRGEIAVLTIDGMHHADDPDENCSRRKK